VANLIDSYLSRLEARLQRRLQTSQTKEHVQEIGVHLHESISDQVSKGKPENAATLDALRSLGSDRLVADSLIRAHSGINERSAWRVTWFSIMLLLIYCLSYQGIKLTTEYWLEGYLRWIAAGFTAAFVYACWRSRKLLIVPVAVSVGIVCFATVFQGSVFYDQNNRRTLQFVNRLIAGGEEQLKELGSVSKTYKNSSFDPLDPIYWAPKPLVTRVVSAVNWTPFTYEIGRKTPLQLAPVRSQAEASALWKLNGDQFAKNLRDGIRHEKEVRTQLLGDKFDPQAFATLAFTTILDALGFIVAIMAVNVLTLGLGSLHRKAISQLWRPDQLKGARHG